MVNPREPAALTLAQLGQALGLQLERQTIVVVIVPASVRLDGVGLNAPERRAAAPADDDALAFFREWVGGRLPLPVGLVTSADLHAAYGVWARLNGAKRDASLATFVSSIAAQPGVRRARQQHTADGKPAQSALLYPPGVTRQAGRAELAGAILSFRTALATWSRSAKRSKTKTGAEK